MHDVEAALHPVSRYDVAEGVGLRVTHVEVTRGVGEHVEDVLGGARIALDAGAEGLQVVPDGQPARLDLLDVVRLGVLVSHSGLTLPRGAARALAGA